MKLDELRLHLHAGPHAVARSAGVVMLVVPDQATAATVDDLLAIAGSGGAGRSLARKAVALLYQHEPAEVPPFCLVAQLDQGLSVVVHGDIDVVVRRPEGDERFSGRDVVTWVDRVVAPDFDSLVVTGPGEGASRLDPWTDLRSGVALGSGFTLAPAGAAEADETQPDGIGVPLGAATPAPRAGEDDAPVAARAPEPAWHADLLIDPEPDEAREPLPLAAAEPHGAEPVGGAVDSDVDSAVVQGIVCSRGHFNDPSSRYCALCGIGMLQVSVRLVPGARPPLGYLVLDDGSTFSLDGDYVIGRSPEEDAGVRAGRARPLVLTDPAKSISRVHAQIVLDNWEVKVADRGSTNGTVIVRPGKPEQEPLTAGEPVVIHPGTRVLIGERSLFFDSHHKT